MAQGGSGPGGPPPGGQPPHGQNPDPAGTGLGAPGFGWGTDPKTGAYRYGQLGANGFLVAGTGEIPPVDATDAHTTGNIRISKRGGGTRSGAGWSSGFGVSTAIIVSLVIVLGAGVFILVSVSKVQHAFTSNIFGGSCVGIPLGKNRGVDIGGGQIRIPCAGGGSMVVDIPGGVPSVRPSPHHHHHHNNGG